VFVKKSYLSSWVVTAMQSAHIRTNSSLSTPLKILDPPMLLLSVEHGDVIHDWPVCTTSQTGTFAPVSSLLSAPG